MQSELAMSIVFDNDKAFRNLTRAQTIMLLLTTKFAATNKGVTMMRTKHYAWHLYNQIYDKMEQAAHATKYAKNEIDRQHVYQLFREQDGMIANISHENEEIKDCMRRIVVSEYKEHLFKLVYHQDNTTLEDLFHLLKCAFMDKYPETYLFHSHDQQHYLFECMNYRFYEVFEMHDKDMLDDPQCKKFLRSIEYDSDDGDDDSNDE